MYLAKETRYEEMEYRRCGKSGLKLPAISLGLWHNFGDITPKERQRELLTTAFDLGITHFDLANNYGPPYGSAEKNFGVIYKENFRPYRDELIISTKAGYDMWPGPYGNWGSRKYLMSSLDQSLRRMKLDYVDIFYHHRPDPETPLEETMGALADIVRQGKALYVGISNYRAEDARKAFEILESQHVHCLIHQPNNSIMDRWIEKELLETLKNAGVGAIAFKPLEQGLLTGKYLDGIPGDSRIAVDDRFLKKSAINEKILKGLRELHAIAEQRGQTMAQLSLAWILSHDGITSALIGASKTSQLYDNVAALKNREFSAEELERIDQISNEYFS